MREARLRYLRQNIIFNFIENRLGGPQDLLNKINEAISEFDPSLQIGVRTLQKQIKDLKENHGWPIKRNLGVYEFEEDFNYEILRDDEKQKINEALLLLQRFNGKQGFEWLDTIDESSFDVEFVNNAIQYEESNTYTDRYFKKIKNAILNKNVLIIKREIFRNSSTIELDVEFHPHFLKIFNNKWYAFGIKKELDVSRRSSIVPNYVIPIDRYIIDINYSRKNYIKSDINYSSNSDNDYFSEVIGVTNYLDKSSQKVKINIHSVERFRILHSKPPHWSWQVVDQSTIPIQVSMTLKINNELENYILRYSPDIEVVEPLELKESIINKLKLILKKYTN